jgi:hypothetical protein
MRNMSGSCNAAPIHRAAQNHHFPLSSQRALAATISAIVQAPVPQAALLFVCASLSKK